jgi:hypothetical protein
MVHSHRELKKKFPARSTIHYLVNKFKTTGSVLDKKIKRRHHVLIEEKLDDTGVRLEH